MNVRMVPDGLEITIEGAKIIIPDGWLADDFPVDYAAWVLIALMTTKGEVYG